MIILTNLHQLTIWMQTVWMRFKRGIISVSYTHLVAGASYLSTVKEGTLPENWEEKLSSFYAQGKITVVKTTKKSEKEVDIRPMIYALEPQNGGIYMLVAAGSAENLKPELVAGAFAKWLGADKIHFSHHRLETYAKSPADDKKLVPLDALGTIRR